MPELKELAGVWKKQGSRGAYYSGQVKETVTIPAGSFINVFKNADATDENRKPPYRVLFSAPDGQRQPQRGHGERGRQACDDEAY